MENSLKTSGKYYSQPLIKNILLAGLVAGTMDISATTFIYSVILAKISAIQILQLIASGAFGKQAFAGGTETAVYGLIFHYIIAFSWAIIYFLMFPHVSFLRKHPLIGGLLYGILVWLVMNLIVLPLSNVSQNSFKWDGVLIGTGTLMICIGLPISLIAARNGRTEQQN